jgi:aspartate kinase
VPSEVFFAEDLGILTDDNFKNSNILYSQSEKNIQKKFKDLDIVPIIPGFTGITKNGDTTTLGRGGTDTTACFIGASLRASKVVLWKDVGGVMSANPKIVKTAKTIPFISYQEAEEAGKIIHDKAIQYVKMHDTPIEITSLADPKQKTTVGNIKKLKHGTKIVSYKKDLVLFTISDESKKENGLLAISSNAFFKHKVDIILISNTQYSIQIVADNAKFKFTIPLSPIEPLTFVQFFTPDPVA